MDRAGANEAAWVAAMRRGDEAAFARLYEAYQGPLYRYALQMCGAGSADDVVQETFLALLRGSRFDLARGTLAAYVFGIARHHILRRLSAARLEMNDGDDALEAPAADATSPFDAMSRAEAVTAVRAAIASLPPVYREIVTLCELEELDYTTAASVVRCPVGTVRSRLHRAKALLAAKLRREGQEGQEGRERQEGHGGGDGGRAERQHMPASRRVRGVRLLDRRSLGEGG